MFGWFGIPFSPRLLTKFPHPVRPQFLVTDAPFRDRFKTAANLCTAIGIDRVFDRAFIVINEKARRSEGLRVRLLHLVKLNGRGNRVSGTAVEMTLIVNGRAIRSEIDSRRQGAQEFAGRLVAEIAIIGKIRDPTMPPGSARPLRRFLAINLL